MHHWFYKNQFLMLVTSQQALIEMRLLSILEEEGKNWKGRPKKGRRNKYPGQTFSTRKKLKDLNSTHYTVKGKLKEKKMFINFECSCH
nr:unnamed protein product [Callosobruchus analis]